MWDYSEKVMEHYRNPKNVGMIKDADLIGEAGSLTCGDSLKLYLKIDKNGIITDAKFQTFGCGSAVASSSVLTEMVIGKSIEEAKKITNQDIADQLGGLPPAKMHCSVMGNEALTAAIANYYGEEVSEHKEEKMVCNCFSITDKFLRDEIKQNNLKTLEDVMNYTKAGGACGRCRGEIQKILNEVNGTPQKLTHTQLVLKVNNVIENHIAPELQKDGGDIELIDIEDLKVKVKLKGACSSCKNSTLTLRYFVESSLKELVDSNIEVIEV